jgi:hypothetical protein
MKHEQGGVELGTWEADGHDECGKPLVPRTGILLQAVEGAVARRR